MNTLESLEFVMPTNLHPQMKIYYKRVSFLTDQKLKTNTSKKLHPHKLAKQPTIHENWFP